MFSCKRLLDPMEGEEIIRRARLVASDSNEGGPIRSLVFPRTALHYTPSSRSNNSTSERGNTVLAAWKSYDTNRNYFGGQQSEEDWFGSAVNGMLWLSLGVDKRTGQLRPPVANIKSRILGGNDVQQNRNAPLQVVNNFVTVHKTGSPITVTERPVQSTDDQRNSSAHQQTQVLEFPLGNISVRDVLLQWVTAVPEKNVHKALMNWTKQERNAGIQKKRAKLYSRRKVICIAFFHALQYMPLEEYESKFTKISGNGHIRKNYEASSIYIKDNRLDKLDQEAWISLCSSSCENSEVKNAIGFGN